MERINDTAVMAILKKVTMQMKEGNLVIGDLFRE